ncbi:unnamed protein product [Schistocephalus solidus]|uniref:Arm_2 domain-containing protein n=1 Tax=Schistocephalus solidus TaxID=70667 RepID=A0A183TE91_SCHSO|nr:unnamed protein product [Schistocephalus solidus]
MFTVRTYLLGTVAALAVGAYWIYRSTYIQRKKSTQGNSTLRLVFNNTSVDKAQHQNEERRRSRDHTVSTVEVEHLVSLLASSNTTKFLKIMKTLLSFTSFRENMKTVDNLFDANLSGLTEEELVAFLRFVGNLALLEDSCPAVSKHAAEIYELLNSKSALVQQQVWTVLLNLSCDPSSLPDLLSAEAVRPDLQLQATLLLPCAPSLSNESIFPDTQRLLEILKNFTEPVF